MYTLTKSTEIAFVVMSVKQLFKTMNFCAKSISSNKKKLTPKKSSIFPFYLSPKIMF
jgi:hypothetical protein